MSRNVAEIGKWAVVDTCAVWNLLSSEVLLRACAANGFDFAITDFVLYECLHKRRRSMTDADAELIRRFHGARSRAQFRSVSLAVDDLQDVARLRARRSVSKGELSSIAFARRVSMAFQTDDQGARRLAVEVLPNDLVQTTPHVLGWLFFHGRFADHDLATVVRQHEEVSRPLRRYFEEMYQEALRCRLMMRNEP